jgi:hypothetical protein
MTVATCGVTTVSGRTLSGRDDSRAGYATNVSTSTSHGLRLMLSSAFGHSKVTTFADRLGIPEPFGLGLLAEFWRFCFRSHPTGEVGRSPDRTIAESIGWPADLLGSPEVLVAVLLDAMLVDPVPDPRVRFVVHDWPDHASTQVRSTLRKSGQRFSSHYAGLYRIADRVWPLPYSGHGGSNRESDSRLAQHLALFSEREPNGWDGFDPEDVRHRTVCEVLADYANHFQVVASTCSSQRSAAQRIAPQRIAPHRIALGDRDRPGGADPDRPGGDPERTEDGRRDAGGNGGTEDPHGRCHGSTTILADPTRRPIIEDPEEGPGEGPETVEEVETTEDLGTLLRAVSGDPPTSSKTSELDDLVRLIWLAYFRPRRRGRAKAIDSIRKSLRDFAKEEGGTTIDAGRIALRSVEAYTEGVTEQIRLGHLEARFVPLATTYFNQQRWRDEYDPEEEIRLTDYQNSSAPIDAQADDELTRYRQSKEQR